MSCCCWRLDRSIKKHDASRVQKNLCLYNGQKIRSHNKRQESKSSPQRTTQACFLSHRSFSVISCIIWDLSMARWETFAILNLHYDFLSFTAEGESFKFRLLSNRIKFISLFFFCRRVSIYIARHSSKPCYRREKLLNASPASNNNWFCNTFLCFFSTLIFWHKIPMYISFTSCRLIFFFHFLTPRSPFFPSCRNVECSNDYNHSINYSCCFPLLSLSLSSPCCSPKKRVQNKKRRNENHCYVT